MDSDCCLSAEYRVSSRIIFYCGLSVSYPPSMVAGVHVTRGARLTQRQHVFQPFHSNTPFVSESPPCQKHRRLRGGAQKPFFPKFKIARRFKVCRFRMLALFVSFPKQRHIHRLIKLNTWTSKRRVVED